MIKAIKLLLLSTVLCTSITSVANSDYVAIGLAGAASGWGLAHAWRIMGKENVPMYFRVPLTAGLAVAAYGIRTQLSRIPRGSDADAVGAAAALGSFFWTLNK